MMEEEEKRRREEKRKQELLLKKRQKQSLHQKHKERRKKDCMIMMPFITAFQGDPARDFYCNDYPDSYELIHQQYGGPAMGIIEKPLARLKRYMGHHVVTMQAKVLIFEAGPDHQCPVCGIGYLKVVDGKVKCEYCGYMPEKQYTK